MVKRLSVVDVNLCVGCQCCMMACNRRFGEGGIAESAIQIKSVGGVERGFIVMVCRACKDPPCMKVCPTNALTKRPGGGVILNHSKCIGCKRCAETCIIDAISWDESVEKPVICVHCGYCTDYCEYDVIKMEEVK